MPPDAGVPHRRRAFAVAAAAAIFTGAVLTSSPQRVGDGTEYLAMARQLGSFRRPSMSELEVEQTRADFHRLRTGFEEQTGTLDLLQLKGVDRRSDCPHFWFYSALAAPGVRLATALGVHPNYGFVLANVALLLLAVWVAAGALEWPALLVVFAPILWWVDKAHTEAFTFALLAIGITLLDRPWWAMVAFAAAATQNVPITAGIPLAAVVGLLTIPRVWRDDRFWTGALAAAAIAALHPLYYFARLGVPEPQTLIGGTQMHVPSLAELRAVVTDPNLGILPCFPALAVVLVTAVATLLATAPRALARPAVIAGAALAAVFLFSFAQTSNFNSGATPGPSRYGLWLVPLTIPLLREAGRHGGRWWRRALVPVALAGGVWTIVTYHPGLPESYMTPTPLARWLWERHPSLDEPLPEVFVERVSGKEVYSFPAPPAATGSCSKVLLVGGQWPARCPAGSDLPAACRARAAYCYANRTSDGTYRFAPIG